MIPYLYHRSRIENRVWYIPIEQKKEKKTPSNANGKEEITPK
jgi:hypothetical protein